jgi:hypothetical protein
MGDLAISTSPDSSPIVPEAHSRKTWQPRQPFSLADIARGCGRAAITPKYLSMFGKNATDVRNK